MTMTTTVESERYDDDDDDSAVLVWMVDRGKRECEEKMQSLTVIVVTVNQSKLTKRCQYYVQDTFANYFHRLDRTSSWFTYQCGTIFLTIIK